MIEIKRVYLNNEEEKNDFLELMEKCLTPKTSSWLNWKYLENPYNVSFDNKPFIFGAYDEEKLIGIGPFMLQQVIYKNKKYITAQPCDTAVDPNYQGRGLFKKMTLKAIEEAENMNINFFFNFPNANSQPGYLKMGWEILHNKNESFLFDNFGKLVKSHTNNFMLKTIGNVLSLYFNKKRKIMKKHKINNLNNIKHIHNVDVNFFDDSFENLWKIKNFNEIRISREKEYLAWRYSRKNKNYDVVTMNDNNKLRAYAILCFSDRWKVKELQIVDFNYVNLEDIIGLIIYIIKEYEFDLINIDTFTEKDLFNALKKLGFYERNSNILKTIMPNRNILIRDLKTNNLKNIFNSVDNWQLRLSDHDVY